MLRFSYVYQLFSEYNKHFFSISADCTRDPYCMTCAAPDVCTKCVPGYNTMDGGPCKGKFIGAFHLSAIATGLLRQILQQALIKLHMCVCYSSLYLQKLFHNSVQYFFYEIQISSVDCACGMKYAIHKNANLIMTKRTPFIIAKRCSWQCVT